MNVNEEYKQIISEIEATLVRKDTLSSQQIATNIVNALTPSHYDTISQIFSKYPELSELECLCGDIEILSDEELMPNDLYRIIDLYEKTKLKYRE